MITLATSTARVQRQLDDEDADVWTVTQVQDFLQDGYDRFCRDTQCIFDMEMYEDRPHTGNYTKEHEKDYMTDIPILARFTITKESDRQYVDPGAPIPSNHTRQDDASYMSTDRDSLATSGSSTRTVGILPARFVSVDRVTHDWLRLAPESARYNRRNRNIYQTESGGVYAYQMDEDGLWNFRTVGVPVRELPTVTISGIFGGIRAFTDDEFDYDDEVVVGTYGGVRQVPQQFASGQYGGVRKIIPDANATRVEYFRLGKNLRAHPFEIPDRYVRYVEWYALYRAYNTPGEGEDKALADHYMQRFQMGIEKMKKRVDDEMKERAQAMGTKRLGKLDSYLERFPSNYGYKRPFRG